MSMKVLMNVPKKQIKDPTEKQKKAGNYKMGHVTFGFQGKISIENAKGSKRYWTDDKGKYWVIMK